MESDTGPEQPKSKLPHLTEDGLLEVVLGMSSIALGLALYNREWLILASAPVWLLVIILRVLPLIRRFFIMPRLEPWWRLAPLTGKTGLWLLVFDGLAALVVLAPVSYAVLTLHPRDEAMRWLARWSPLFLGGAIMFELTGLSFRLACRRYRTLALASLLIGVSGALYEAQHALEPLAVLAIGLGFATLMVGVLVWGRFVERHPLPWQR